MKKPGSMQNSQHTSAENIARITGNILQTIRNSFHRHCLILAGTQPWYHAAIRAIHQHNRLRDLLIVADTPLQISDSEQTNSSNATRYLGHEFAHAVIDFHDGIDPNILGAISGTVSGGGLLILLSPALAELQNFPDPENQRMAIWPHDAADVGTRFLQRLKRILNDAEAVSIIEENGVLPAAFKVTSAAELRGYLDDDICRTQDQSQAVAAIEHVVKGHRRRPLVITANRGRGKSAALGIAAARLLQQGTQRIIVTGPRLSATALVFKHAQTMLPGAQYVPGNISIDTGRLEYIAPDILCRDAPACNLLLIDEAAAIPVTMLQQLLQHYARIVFSTTTYGYEGTGRGFAVKFQETLNSETPGWQALQMELPIRWAPGDPLENFVFRCLCLDATVAEAELPVELREINIIKLDRDSLIEDEALLSAIFGLLVLAHYQTQPRDLRYLLDAIDLDIYVATYNSTVIGTAVVEQEGKLDTATAGAVYRNERRVMGHLLPQTLESFVGIRRASEARYARIVRIAVHPDYRRRGIGRQLLGKIETDASQQRCDILGSTFGASTDLLDFWRGAGFAPVHVGLKHNTSTGTHAITYLKPTSDQGESISHAAIARLACRFTFQLGEAYQDLECEVVKEIYKTFNITGALPLTENDWDDITSFATALRGYEINAHPLHKLITHLFEAKIAGAICTPVEQCLLIKKVLQRQSWQETTFALGLPGKQDAIHLLRNTLSKIINASLTKSIIEVGN
jgi:tRNA(Met) cytidine acetyltransferase